MFRNWRQPKIFVFRFDGVCEVKAAKAFKWEPLSRGECEARAKS